MNLEPRVDCKPSISIMSKVDDCVDSDCIYVMKDPDRLKLKIDVLFFAQSSGNSVRVFCQLTVQNKSSTMKANEALEEILKIKRIEGTTDYRMFLAPKSSVRIPKIYRDNFEENRCFFFDQDTFESMMELPLELCDSSNTSKSLMLLRDIAKNYSDDVSTQRISFFLLGNKRKRGEFVEMDEFYEELREIDVEDWDIKIIQRIFTEHSIRVKQLRGITVERLKEMGITQVGLQIAVLDVLSTQ